MQNSPLRRPAVALLSVFTFGSLALSPICFSQEKKKPADAAKPKAEEKKTPEAPPIHKVKAGLFEIKVDLEGAFEATQSSPIAIDSKAWTDLTVVSVSAHGEKVKKGDVIAKFDDEKLRKAIDEIIHNTPLAELTLETAVAELDTLEKTTPLDLEASRRSKMQAEENLAYFEDITLPMKKRDVEEGQKRGIQSLSYAEEELNQLKKMYKQDDLTEETEEIILTRSQNQVNTIKWQLEQSKARSERTLNTSIPREHEALTLALDRTQVTWRATEKSTRAALEKKRLEVEKAHRDHDKAAEKLADMEADLKLLTVTAPHDGIVYYGASARGKWITGQTIEKKLVPGGKVLPKEIFITLVDPSQQQIRVSTPEAKLKHLKPGIEGTASPAWDGDTKLETKINTINYVPFADKTFDTVFTTPKNAAEQIFPGMGAKISLELYKKEKALTVPKKAVKKEGADHFVTMKDGKKQKVKIGKSNATMTEILEGLKAGDEVKTK